MDHNLTADNQPNTRQGERTAVSSNTRPVTVITDGVVQNPRYTFVPIRTNSDEGSFAQAAPGVASLPELPAVPPSIQRQAYAGGTQALRLQPKFSQDTHGQNTEVQDDSFLKLKRRFSVLKDPGSGEDSADKLATGSAGNLKPAAELPRADLERNDNLRTLAGGFATPTSIPDPVQGVTRFGQTVARRTWPR